MSPCLFNTVLEKVINEWRKEYKVKPLNRIQLGYANDNLNTECLAIAANLTKLAEDIEIIAEQIDILQEMAERLYYRSLSRKLTT